MCRNLFIYIFLLNNILCADYCLEYGRKCDSQIRQVKTMTERCSGSTYTESLIVTNAEGVHSNINAVFNGKFGSKHFSPWFDYESSYYGPAEDYTFTGSENVLFIIIFRDPYDWLRSLKKSCFLGPASHQVCNFFNFIRMPWGGLNTTYTSPALHSFIERLPLVDLNPSTREPFENIIKMRTAKIKNFLQIRARVKNYVVINYETTRDYPKEVMQELAGIFDLKLKAEFHCPSTIRGYPNSAPYIPIQYPPISPDDIEFINSQLDEELENSIGYQIKDSVS